MNHCELSSESTCAITPSDSNSNRNICILSFVAMFFIFSIKVVTDRIEAAIKNSNLLDPLQRRLDSISNRLIRSINLLVFYPIHFQYRKHLVTGNRIHSDFINEIIQRIRCSSGITGRWISKFLILHPLLWCITTSLFAMMEFMTYCIVVSNCTTDYVCTYKDLTVLVASLMVLVLTVYAVFIQTMRKLGVGYGLLIWSLSLLCADYWWSEQIEHAYRHYRSLSNDSVRWCYVILLSCIAANLVLSLYSEYLFLENEIHSFVGSTGGFIARWIPMEMVTSPFRNECRVLDRYILEQPLYHRLDSIRAINGAVLFPSVICQIFLDFLTFDDRIRALAEGTSTASPCFVIHRPIGPGSQETMHIPIYGGMFDYSHYHLRWSWKCNSSRTFGVRHDHSRFCLILILNFT